ncbi:unnamed protein product [Nippostrongylus brasiliensis]|uniref:BTB domain-containing protein n=1 Tax=Nippostrongylus brasiliensis TaxID=27835 RepID=A0A0N4Y434_NIPBR|nr:hypothetical protein Q1695_009453 [Nippostrongylus brasiliensis]VDL74215.1 unnamed protein product [Nippostrongylus brasiliensis]
MSASPVILNVGGVKFYTTVATLSGEDVMEGSFFATLDYTKGEIFIDRDPTVFRYVLNFLRDRRVIFPDDGLTAALLFQEAKFYGLGKLVERISLSLKNATGYLDIKANNSYRP